MGVWFHVVRSSGNNSSLDKVDRAKWAPDHIIGKKLQIILIVDMPKGRRSGKRGEFCLRMIG